MHKNGIALVIPFYNEGERIVETLKQVAKNKYKFDEIICVNDGSIDNANKRVSSQFPEVKLLNLPQNTGKSNAVREGVSIAKSENIFLIDADINGLDKFNFKEAVLTFIKNNLDLLIITPHKDNTIDNMILKSHKVISGCRILKKIDALNVFKFEKPSRFQLEVAINKYMFKRNKRIRIYESELRNTIHYKKQGVLNAILKEVKMYYQIFSFSGYSEFVRQIKYVNNMVLK